MSTSFKQRCAEILEIWRVEDVEDADSTWRKDSISLHSMRSVVPTVSIVSATNTASAVDEGEPSDLYSDVVEEIL